MSVAIPSARDPTFLRFIAWLKATGQRYQTEDLDDAFINYIRTEERISENTFSHNVGLNWFSGHSTEEFSTYPCGLAKITNSDVPKEFKSTISAFPTVTEEIPTSFDWTTQYTPSPVSEQRDCSSCGVFSAVGAIEGGWVARGHSAESLSVQQLIDCNPSSKGCVGTLPVLAFSDLMSASQGKVETSYDYPCDSCQTWTQEKKAQCQFNEEKASAVITGFESYCDANSAECDETKMASTLYKYGPLSVCLNAALFQDYEGGIINPTTHQCDADAINHCVTLVGYGVERGQLYWKIKNSFGEKWGENGYAKIARGRGACGINRIVSAPTF